jgi:transposase
VERAEAEAIYDQGREVVVAVLLRMDEQIQRLTERVARQEERIGELERRLGRNSRNSSLPPSQDPPGSAPRRGTGRSGRTQGGQPGHEGHGRPLLPAWAVDEVIDHWPERCACGHVFGDAERVAAGEAARHQVEELPVMATHVTEHRAQRVRCPDCGARQTGPLPAEVATSAFGPRLQAAIVTLSVRNRVSRRDVVECCEQLFSARISTGSVEAILQRAGDALEAPYAHLLAAVRGARHVNMDETGWRLRGQRRFLWGAFSARHAVLRIMADRDADRVWELLASSTATVTSDRWWAYDQLPLRRRQVCWAHLKRDFAAHADGLGAQRELGEHGLRICDELFWAWEIYQHTGDRHQLQRRVLRLRRQLKPILRRYATKTPRNKRTRGIARNLLKLWPALWTFTTATGVEPTNNHAERALRGAVIYRKLALGSQSTGGERRLERLLSAHTTCRLQRRSLHAYLVDLLRAHARSDPLPLLA